MKDTAEQCRYLLRDGSRCQALALMPHHEVLVCKKHMINPIDLLAYAGKVPMTERDLTRERIHNATAAREEARRKRISVVYYILFRDRIKIGTTTNFRIRRSSLPYDKILATEPGDIQIEQRRHRQFRHCRENGEWFRSDDPVLLAHIAELTRTQTPQ